VLKHQYVKQILDDADRFETGHLSRRVFERFVPKSLIVTNMPNRMPIRRYSEERLHTGCTINEYTSLAERLRLIVSEESKSTCAQTTINWNTLSELAARIVTRVIFGTTLAPAANKRVVRKYSINL